MNKTDKKQWWEMTFDDKYINTYVDLITPEITKRQISFIVKVLKLKKGSKILDLACGYGRHAIELAKLGYSVTGVDLSNHFLRIARNEAQEQKVKVRFIKKDMRKLSFLNKFDAVINIFTSFGYFDNEKDNLLVLKQVSQALKNRGKFLIDLNNPFYLILNTVRNQKNIKTNFLTSRKKQTLSNKLRVTTKEQFNLENMRWSMIRTWRESGRVRSYKTSIRMFTPSELKHLLEMAGLKIEKIWGNFLGSKFGLNSRRLIILARKK